MKQTGDEDYPRTSEPVLVCVKKEGMQVAILEDLTFDDEDPRPRQWYTDNDEHRSLGKRVTHWTYLPELPSVRNELKGFSQKSGRAMSEWCPKCCSEVERPILGGVAYTCGTTEIYGGVGEDQRGGLTVTPACDRIRQLLGQLAKEQKKTAQLNTVVTSLDRRRCVLEYELKVESK